jgi:hypothetical protein
MELCRGRIRMLSVSLGISHQATLTCVVQRFIFEGLFLDTRSTIVFAIFFFVGTYFLGSIRAIAPKLWV